MSDSPADGPSRSSNKPDPAALDAQMAEILAGDEKSISRAKRRLRESDQPGAGDLLSRLDALDFVDSVVGAPGSDLPERLGEYRITDLLGRGGMGTVFEAFQESLERSVALKVLAPSLTTDSSMRRRFRAEARANATLHHQHIVPVYGFGESAGYLYFTMERVDGVSLDKHIARLRVEGQDAFSDPREVAGRFAGVADALAHAHRRGILHRDVKPGNILVHPDGSYALADFGLSKMLGAKSMSMSAAGGFLGTLQYAAPEQARGRDFCPATDLYGLGVTMFETLTGELPISGKTTEALLDGILHTEATRLAQRLPKVPRDLDAVMVKLLSKEPEDRYQDGEELARDLLRVADDEPVKIRRQSLAVRAWRRIRKHPSLSGMIALAVVLLGVILVLGKLQRDDTRRTKFERFMRNASILVEREPGNPAGPAGLFAALTGRPAPDVADEAAPEFAAFIELAAEIFPEDNRPVRMQDAFLSDPAPAATRALSFGEGFAAHGLLTKVIDRLEANTGLSTRDGPTLLQLYRLYVARAVANLTPANAHPSAAGKDLIKATMLRRRAFFPRLLTTILDWRPTTGVDDLETSLEGLLDGAPAGATSVVGSMLVAMSRIDGSDDANLMEFDLEFGVRRQLWDLGVRWIGEDDVPLVTAEDASTPRTVEGRLRRSAERILDVASSQANREAERRRGDLLLAEHVAPDAPLRSWQLVFDLIADPGAARAQLEPSFDPAVAFSQMRALTDYLRLEPARSAVSDSWTAARDVLDSLANPKGRQASRLRAMFLARIGPSAAAIAAANDWVEADANDPEAYLCRMRCWAPQDLARAASEAVNAIVRSPDRNQMRSQVVSALQTVADTNPRLSAHPDLPAMLQKLGGGGS